MSRPKTYKTEAIVVKQIPFGEADRIYTLLTMDLGKVRAVARGVRRTKSRLRGHIELLNRMSVSLAKGRDLDIISEVQTLAYYPLLRNDLSKLSMGIYVAELLEMFSVEQSPSYELYELLDSTLNNLQDSNNSDLLLRHFEMRLLYASGYSPELFSCVDCRSNLEPERHSFSYSAGGVKCPDCTMSSNELTTPISINSMKILRFVQKQLNVGRVADVNVGNHVAQETKRILQNYIKYILEREIKSTEFMNLVLQ